MRQVTIYFSPQFTTDNSLGTYELCGIFGSIKINGKNVGSFYTLEDIRIALGIHNNILDNFCMNIIRDTIAIFPCHNIMSIIADVISAKRTSHDGYEYVLNLLKDRHIGITHTFNFSQHYNTIEKVEIQKDPIMYSNIIDINTLLTTIDAASKYDLDTIVTEKITFIPEIKMLHNCFAFENICIGEKMYYIRRLSKAIIKVFEVDIVDENMFNQIAPDVYALVY